ncbi:TPA: SDR family oxidoreductase [Candidatus Saccharibacteria bacterium]|nr:SDR family oxidoreductase [Candidatus Saccharibacteria bacterium]HIO87773.1 SDR family oxidoreductase [Candidatus Saccharibacteria bacterium]
MKHATLITGASSGIGKEFAYIAAAEGRNLVLTARSKDKLNALKKELAKMYPNQLFEVIVSDLSQPDQADQLYKTAASNYKVDVVVNNAGFGDLHSLKDADSTKLHEMIQLNCSSLVTLSKKAADDMTKNGGGHILNVASVAAFFPGPHMATYYATKAFVLSFSEAIAVELEDDNVVVSALCPGPTQSEFAATAKTNDTGVFANQSKLPTAKEVARYGWDSLMQNKTVAVHGTRNIAAVQLCRILPRKVVTRFIARSQKTS